MDDTGNGGIWGDKDITNCGWSEVIKLHDCSGFGVFL